MMKIHGIPNCDTVKKARAWVAAQGHGATFHDLRRDGVDAQRVARWQAAVGDALINRKGTTWRGLDATAQAGATADEATARALVLAQPALIRRPLVEWPDGSVTVGFDPADWAARLA